MSLEFEQNVEEITVYDKEKREYYCPINPACKIIRNTGTCHAECYRSFTMNRLAYGGDVDDWTVPLERSARLRTSG